MTTYETIEGLGEYVPLADCFVLDDGGFAVVLEDGQVLVVQRRWWGRWQAQFNYPGRDHLTAVASGDTIEQMAIDLAHWWGRRSSARPHRMRGTR